jgi:hypothetical protein
MEEPDDIQEQEATEPDDDLTIAKFKGWFRKDKEHSAEWRRNAREDYDFVAGEQWTDEDKAALKAKMRPVIVFNRVATTLNAVSGMEIGNRQEVRYLPRTEGDAKPNELLTSAAEWFRDGCDAEDEESDMFLDAAICGYGWTETRLDVDEDPEGTARVDRVDPLEMYFDHAARRRNLTDARRVWRVRAVPCSEAKAMFPGKSRAELDASSWAKADAPDKPVDADAIDRYTDEDAKTDRDDGMVTLVQVQWRERVPVWQIADPVTGGTTELEDKNYQALSKRFAKFGLPLEGTQITRMVYKQAFLGSVILESGPAPCKEHFSFNCATGYRDRNKGTFYGLVRSMKDPQRWANKWLSQTLHIMNSSAKGGLIAERGVSDDQRQFESSWAKNDEITYVRDGALGQHPRIQPKPQSQFPAGFYQLMEFAVSSVRDVTGVSLELLGMRDAAQPASLEYQRRQAGVTILATLFDSLRRYRKLQGRVMLYIIQNYLSDGRLIRIVGEEGAQYVPLMKQADAQYDIIVDDAPTSPNQKEMIWQALMPMMPTLPPQVQLALLEYSPLPTTVVEKIKKAAQEAMQAQAMQARQGMAMEAAKTQADIGKTKAETVKTLADAQQNDPRQQMMIEQQKIGADVALKREEMATDAQLEIAKMLLDARVKMATRPTTPPGRRPMN